MKKSVFDFLVIICFVQVQYLLGLCECACLVLSLSLAAGQKIKERAVALCVAAYLAY